MCDPAPGVHIAHGGRVKEERFGFGCPMGELKSLKG